MQVNPKECGKNANFWINTENFRKKEDIRCDDDGSWINNGVRKIYWHIQSPANPKKLRITVIKHGGRAPNDNHWCLTRTYFVFNDSKDFKKMAVSLQGHYF